MGNAGSGCGSMGENICVINRLAKIRHPEGRLLDEGFRLFLQQPLYGGVMLKLFKTIVNCFGCAASGGTCCSEKESPQAAELPVGLSDGECGIRTHVPSKGQPHFECGSL